MKVEVSQHQESKGSTPLNVGDLLDLNYHMYNSESIEYYWRMKFVVDYLQQGKPLVVASVGRSNYINRYMCDTCNVDGYSASDAAEKFIKSFLSSWEPRHEEILEYFAENGPDLDEHERDYETCLQLYRDEVTDTLREIVEYDYRIYISFYGKSENLVHQPKKLEDFL